MYVLVGSLWIAFSDRVVEAWFGDTHLLSTVQTWKGFAFVLVTGAVLFGVLKRQLNKDRKLVARLQDMATRDALTGLANRRETTRVLAEEIERARRYRRSLAVLWVDFDRFKTINDTLGHAAGDQVLQSASRTLLDSVRAVDTVGRFGGEEFVIVLPEMRTGEARDTAERLRRRIADQPIALASGESVRLTISIGVAVYPDHGDDVDALCAAADNAMYLAKAGGRNCVVLAVRPMPANRRATTLASSSNDNAKT